MEKELEKYMFTNDNLSRLNDPFFKTNKKTNKMKNEMKNEKKVEDDFFTPKEKDRLFWCFYYILNGNKDESFNAYGSTFKMEKDFKINRIKKIRENKTSLKANKLNIEDIESTLANEEKINLETFQAMCLIENLSVILIKNRTYYHFHYSDGEPHIIYYDKVVIQMKEKYMNMIDSYYHIENVKKPIGSFSNYKLDELQNIAIKLDIDIMIQTKKKQKKLLYCEIIEKIN